MIEIKRPQQQRWMLLMSFVVVTCSMMYVSCAHAYNIIQQSSPQQRPKQQYQPFKSLSSPQTRIYSSSASSDDPSMASSPSSSFGTSPISSSSSSNKNNTTIVIPFSGSLSSPDSSGSSSGVGQKQSFGSAAAAAAASQTSSTSSTLPSDTTTSNKVSFASFFGMKPTSTTTASAGTTTSAAAVVVGESSTTNSSRNGTTTSTVMESPPTNSMSDDEKILSQLQQVVEEVFSDDDNEYEHIDLPVLKENGTKQPETLADRSPSEPQQLQQPQKTETVKDTNNKNTQKTTSTSTLSSSDFEESQVTALSSDTVNVDAEDDIMFMKMAIELAQSEGGEHGPSSAYPNPTTGAILVSTTTTKSSIDGTISTSSKVIGRGRSDYRTEAVRACFEDAGLTITPLSEWVVSWPISIDNINDIQSRNITLYTTLEPSTRRRGTATPPVTNLIRMANIQRIVIGCPSPVPEKAMLGASALHNAGVVVKLIQSNDIREQCEDLITDFSISSNSKLQRMARKHYQLFGRPLGFLHCSVIHSDNIEAFRRHGNAFGTGIVTAGNTAQLSFRNLGSYELAPPPDNIWATDNDVTNGADNNDGFDDTLDGNGGNSVRIDDEFVMVDFEEEEEYQGIPSSRNSNFDVADSISGRRNWDGRNSPMMPWYNQVDAVVVTFPRSGNGPPNDDSITSRLNGIKWLATHGNLLSAGVERIVVCDATELRHLPLHNSDPNLPRGVDIESFWSANGRKPTRIILRRGVHEGARAAAAAAAVAAQAAANAAQIAADAIESGDATKAAAAAMECERAAMTSKNYIEQELESTQIIRRRLEDLGVIVETIEGGEPIDIMQHLGERNGLYSVVWRAGCWGERGVRAILAGAFQWVSAHIAVPADGGRFWQLMMAENAVQGACGPRSKVKVFADQDDISMEYCNEDDDCVLSVDGKPIRHVRLDCRVALMDGERKREFDIAKTQTMNRKVLVEQAPWFL